MNLQVQVRNAFRHVNVGGPSSRCIDCSGAAEAGQITDILGGTFASMRQLQFAAKFSF
ncbi:MAG TPA: hypothetical protein VGR96_03940 [Acidobacteriaceae bacterium]|nr:hypothetical protein [Acidobacteriaceae bacterium]